MHQAQLTEHYCVRVAGESLCFSAAHFITFADGAVEPLHGHDYRVAAEIEAPLNPLGYVVDFVTVEQILKDVIRRWDHRTLLPEHHPEFRLEVRKAEVEISLGARRWTLPREHCAILPLSNTTAEAIAGHLAAELLAKLNELDSPSPVRIRMELTESPGFTAVCTLRSL